MEMLILPWRSYGKQLRMPVGGCPQGFKSLPMKFVHEFDSAIRERCMKFQERLRLVRVTCALTICYTV